MKIDSTEIEAPPNWTCQNSGKTCGAARSPDPAMTSAAFWRMNETPIAVIRGASLRRVPERPVERAARWRR